MISKQMYRILKKIPYFPKSVTLIDLRKKLNIDVSTIWHILEDALGDNYIVFASRSSSNDLHQSPFSLTESGQIALETYEGERNSSRKSTWALIISALSLIVSIIAIIISYTVQ